MCSVSIVKYISLFLFATSTVIVTPMVKAVDQKNLAHISNGIEELCRQAQESTKAASVDYLVADGAIGVKWIKTFKRVPEPPLELLL